MTPEFRIDIKGENEHGVRFKLKERRATFKFQRCI